MGTNVKEIQPKLFDWRSCPEAEGYYWMWDNDCEFLPPKPHIYYIHQEDEIGWIASTPADCGIFRIILENAPLFHFYGPLPFPPENELESVAPWENEYNARIAKGTRVRCKKDYNDKTSIGATYLGRTADFTDFVKLDDGTIIEAKSVELIG